MKAKVLEIIEEQVAIGFTGRVNILVPYNRQFLGFILLKNGELYRTLFHSYSGLKAFYQLIIKEIEGARFDYVVEPELVEENERQIHFPYSVIKNKIPKIIQDYEQSKKLRPPDDVKILINSNIISGITPLTPNEFKVLDCLTQWSQPIDVYRECKLFEHEIILSLASLRKKGGLKIIAPKKDS